MGMTQFCNQFIENLNPILAPLHHLTKVSTPFVWSEECNTAFETVKQMLTQSPVLCSPSDSNHFISETDASNIGTGSCLKISDPHGWESIVGYHSVKFHDTEINWNVVEKEAHAIINAVQQNQHYLIGKRFSIRTDSRVLTYLLSKHRPKNKKLLNWALELSEYEFDIVHIPSKFNTISDYLSRLERVCSVLQMPSFT